MSASKEKKTHQEGAVLSDPKTAREAKQRKEEKKSNILYGLIAIAFVIVAVVSITWKTGVVQRNVTAATINGKNYSAAEVQYYYQSAYQSFLNNYGSYASYFGLDTSKDLKSQSCAMSEDADTWYDYFIQQGLQSMSSVHALCDAADADGFTWNDDMQSSYDDAMNSLKTSASNYGYDMKQYIKAAYGKLVTEKIYEKQVKLSIQAQAYSSNYSDSLTYTTDDLQKAYSEDPNSYDVVDYQSVKVDGTAEASTDSTASSADSSAASSSGASSAASSSAAAEPTDEEKAAALEAAKETANSIYSSYQSGKGLSDLADANDKATYTDGTGATYSDSVLMNWLFDTSRKAGDSAVLADEDNSAYYVVIFGDRYRNEYSTVDVRHILIQPETGEKAEGDDGYDEEQAQLKADAKKKADDLLAQWKSGDATEDSFAQLAKDNSSDSGSSSKGGLYEQVYKGEMVGSFEDWCFDSSRKPGDTGVVETDYGYHVMYFVGEDLPYWQVQVTNSLKSQDYNDWYTNLTKDYDATQHSFGCGFIG